MPINPGLQAVTDLGMGGSALTQQQQDEEEQKRKRRQFGLSAQALGLPTVQSFLGAAAQFNTGGFR